MADDTPDTAAPPSAAGIDPATLAQLIRQTLRPPPPVPDAAAGPSSRDGRGFLSLLGEALGGGQQYGSTAEREQGGLAAAQAAGARMMIASDWSATPHTLGSIIGQGYGAARESLGQTQSVSAARAAAAQALAHQQQEDQLARIKEAIPLLTLQQQQALLAQTAGMPSSLGGGGNIGTAGDGTYEGAVGGHEGTGQNPRSSAFGTGQFLASTWRDFAAANPDLFKGMTPEQVLAARADPAIGRQAITWLAQQNADALTKQGVTPDGPLLGIAHYLGVGPAAAIAKAPPTAPVSNYVSAAALAANPELARMTVGQMRARYANTPAPSFLRPGPTPGAPPGAPGTQQAGIPAPPRPVGQQPGAPVQIPPPTVPTVQTAGPGAGTPPETPPAPTPTPGAAPGAPPGGVDPETGLPVAAGLTPPPGAATSSPTMEPPPVFTYVPRPLPASLLPTGGLSPGEQQTFDAARRAYESAIHVPGVTPQQRQAAEMQLQKTLDSQLTVQAGHAKELSDAVVKLGEADYKQQQGAFDKQLEDYYKRGQFAREQAAREQDARTAAANKLAEIEATGRQQRESTAAGAVVESNKRVRDSIGDDATAAAKSIPQLEALRALSDNVDESTAPWAKMNTRLATIPFGGTTLLNRLTQLGLVDPTTAGPVQQLQGGISGVVAQLRQGMSMGALSDRDLSFIESLGPSLYEDKATRSAVISYLQQSQRAKIRFNSVFNEEMAKPGASAASALAAARDYMDSKHPIVPQMTPDLEAHWTDPAPDWRQKRIEWARDNGVRPNMLVRRPNGALKLLD